MAAAGHKQQTKQNKTKQQQQQNLPLEIITKAK